MIATLLVNFAKNRNDANISVTITDSQVHTKIFCTIRKFKGKKVNTVIALPKISSVLSNKQAVLIIMQK
jgi:hypothetical protein